MSEFLDRKYLTPEERVRFFRHVEGISNIAHKSLCLVLIYTGCRISEALDLRRRDVEPDLEVLTFRTLKQRTVKRTRKLVVPGFVIACLQEQIAATKGTYIWSFSRWTGRRIVKKIMADIGLTGVKATPKGLRHSFTVSNSIGMVPINTVSKWLGHANLATTSHYLDFVGPEERALAARAWPHLESIEPLATTAPVVSATEIEVFNFETPDQRCLDQMNASIKAREAAGWAVSQIEHLTSSELHNGRRVAYTAGMMVVFGRPMTVSTQRATGRIHRHVLGAFSCKNGP